MLYQNYLLNSKEQRFSMFPLGSLKILISKFLISTFHIHTSSCKSMYGN